MCPCPPDVSFVSNIFRETPDWQVFHPQSGDFVQFLAKKTRFICYITLICCELNFFVLADWAGTAKKKKSGNLPHKKNDTGSY